VAEDLFADGWSVDTDADLAERVEAGLRVEPLARAAEAVHCLGATRFIVAPEFEPEALVTCLWRPGSVVIEFVWSRTCILEPAVTACGSETRWRRSLPLLVLPGLIRGWPAVKRAVARAPSCCSFAIGGAFCWHRLWEAGVGETFHDWFNPDEKEHPAQCAAVAAYLRLLTACWLLSWLPGWAAGWCRPKGGLERS
jgi:hypothetical protein